LDHLAHRLELAWVALPHCVSSPALPLSLGPLVVSDFSGILAEFNKKRFSLLWRNWRDGFGAHDFDSRCHGDADPLTMILDTNGNVLRAFTPVEWDCIRYIESDDSQRSFFCTLTDPANIPATKFPLTAHTSRSVVCLDCGHGPCFGDGTFVGENWNANNHNWTDLGEAYGDCIGLDRHTVLAGTDCLRAVEVEIFEVTQQRALVSIETPKPDSTHPSRTDCGGAARFRHPDVPGTAEIR
jgi:hypothetical protein